MGKDKDIKERRKKNVKGPSSSAAAAEFATKGGFSDAFARFKAGGIVSQELLTGSSSTMNNDTPVLASFDAISDPTLRTNFKHLNKKDSTTRIKALTHIAANIKDKPQNEIVQALPEWIVTLKKLVLDNTRRVREQAFIVFQLIVDIAKKDLGPYLRSIMGIWLISMHDHDREVARAAQDAFNTAFSTVEKRERALQFCEQEIMDQLINNFQLTVQTLSDSKSASQSEAEERYNRYMSSSIDALAYLIRNGKTQNEKCQQICSNKNFWKFLTIKNFGDIRASTFKLVATVSTVSPGLIEPILDSVSPLVLGCFNEVDPVVHEAMIESLISFMKQFPNAWSYVKPWKAIFPRLWTFLKNPENSSPSKTFQTLLPFVSLLSYDVIGASNETSFKFFDQFLSNMWTGYLSDRVQATERQIIFNTFTEVCMFGLLQAKRYIVASDENSLNDAIYLFISNTFKNHFEKAIKYYLVSKEVPREEQACRSISVALHKFMDREQMNTVIQQFWSSMIPFSVSALEHADQQELFSVRLYQLLKNLRDFDDEVVLNTKSYLSFACDLFHICLDKTLESNSAVHLLTAFRISDAVPLQKILSSDEIQFYHHYLVELFGRYLANSAMYVNQINSLYGVLGHYFNAYPVHFKSFDVIIDQLVERPHLLNTLVQAIYTAQSGQHEKLRNAKLDDTVVNFAHKLKNYFTQQNSETYFYVYLDLIEYLTVDQQVASQSTVQSILTDIDGVLALFNAQSPDEQRFFDDYVIKIVKYLQLVLPLQTNVQDRCVMNLLEKVFELRTYSRTPVSYISDMFYSTCKLIGPASSGSETVEENIVYTSQPDHFPFFDSVQSEESEHHEADLQESSQPDEAHENNEEDEEEEEHNNDTGNTDTDSSRISDIATEVWDSIYAVCITKDNAKQFVSEAVAHIKEDITNSTKLTVTHSQLLRQCDTLETIASDIGGLPSSEVWDHLTFNRSIWTELRNACEQILQQIAIGNDVFLVPFTGENDSSRVVDNIQLYGRFLQFALNKLLTFSNLFSYSDLSTQSDIWLATEILHSSQTQLAVSESTSSLIRSFISNKLLPSLLLFSDVKSSLGQEFIDRFIEVCKYLLALAAGNHSYYKDLRAFIMSTLTYLHQDSIENESGRAVGALRGLFQAICDRLLFNNSLEELLRSHTQCQEFSQIIESLFSAYLDADTLDFVVVKLRTELNQGKENDLHDKTITWISQCASILMQHTQEIGANSFDVQSKKDELMNLLRVQSSLAIFINHLKNPEESIVSMHFVVSVTSEFANTLLASDIVNDIMDLVDLIVSRMLFYIYRNSLEGGLALDENSDEFLVSFVEQHMTRCISLLDSGAFSYDDISRMIETLYYMVELSVSFVQTRLSGGNQETVRRVYTQLLNSMNALAGFQILLDSDLRYRRLRIFHQVNDRLMSDIAISIRTIPGDIFTAIDKSYEGNLKFSVSLLNILRTSTSIHALITAHDLLRKHQDTSYFVVECTKESSNNTDLSKVIGENENKLVLLPALVELLRRPHKEVKLSPIYEHLKWNNMHSFTERNERLNLHYRMLPYFLAWSIAAHLYEQGNDDQKAIIFSTLKDNLSYITVLNAITSYILTGAKTNPFGLTMHEILHEKDLTSTDTTVVISKAPKSTRSMADVVDHESITLLGAQVFFRLMRTYPSLIRLWYINCLGSKVVKHVTTFVTTKVCPIVIDHELDEILSNTRTSMPDHVKVKVTKGRNQIVATYEQDEVQLDITVSIPSDYPLKALKIESSKRLGVSEMQWRKWTLKMTTVLFSHEGKLWDALMLWKENLDRHFEGVEACPICYSIVHTHDHALPKIRCKVCRSKYHAACLYKWFTTSGQSSCPTCRSTNSFL